MLGEFQVPQRCVADMHCLAFPLGLPNGAKKNVCTCQGHCIGWRWLQQGPNSEDTDSEEAWKGTTITMHHPGLPPLTCSPPNTTFLASPTQPVMIQAHTARRSAGLGIPRSLFLTDPSPPCTARPTTSAPQPGPTPTKAASAAGSEEHEDSEAGLILLSIAQIGTDANEGRTLTLPIGVPASRPPPTTVLAAQLAAQGTAQMQAPPPQQLLPAAAAPIHTMPAHPCGPDSLSRLMPHLGQAQLLELKALCAAFDASYQELVSAHAACEAVGHILAAKAQHAGAVRASARHVIEKLVVQASQAVRASEPQVRQALVSASAASSAASSAAAPPASHTQTSSVTTQPTAQPGQQVVDDTAVSDNQLRCQRSPQQPANLAV